jgi:hypothetical protein
VGGRGSLPQGGGGEGDRLRGVGVDGEAVAVGRLWDGEKRNALVNGGATDMIMIPISLRFFRVISPQAPNVLCDSIDILGVAYGVRYDCLYVISIWQT